MTCRHSRHGNSFLGVTKKIALLYNLLLLTHQRFEIIRRRLSLQAKAMSYVLLLVRVPCNFCFIFFPLTPLSNGCMDGFLPDVFVVLFINGGTPLKSPSQKILGLKTSTFWIENSYFAVFGRPLCRNDEEFWENLNNCRPITTIYRLPTHLYVRWNSVRRHFELLRLINCTNICISACNDAFHAIIILCILSHHHVLYILFRFLQTNIGFDLIWFDWIGNEMHERRDI